MLKIKVITGYIVLKSGLHIGGNKDTMQIGGIDSPVIKNPLTNLPYIPGSSLKGKIRFLLEHYLGVVKTGDIPVIDSNNKILKTAIIFGHMNHDIENTRPTRVIFSDSNIVGLLDSNGVINNQVLKDKTFELLEAKTEVNIDRLTGTQGGGLRTIERVPAGVVFDLHIVLKEYDSEADSDHLEILKKGLKLLANDALGGSGSRGSGRIEFRDLRINGEEVNLDAVTL